MPVPLIALGVFQGASFAQIFTVQTTSGTPPVTAPNDLTGCTARMMIRSSYGTQSPPLVTLTTENGGIALGGTAGTIDVLLTPAQTLALPVVTETTTTDGFGRTATSALLLTAGPPSTQYVADLDVIFPSGDIERYLNLILTVYATVTR